MKRIRAIFTSFSKQELKYLKSFLQAFHGKGSNKALALVELLEKNSEISQHTAAEKLYGNPKSKAFIMLKGRLLEKMKETLSLAINLQNNEQLQEDMAAYEVVGILKQLGYALMLRKRGLEEIAQEIFEKCEKKALEAGLPEYRLPPLIYLQNISASKTQGTWGYSQQIQETLAQYQTDILGIGVFDEFNLMTRHYAHFTPAHLDWLQEKIALLEKQLQTAYTIRTHYFYCNLLVSYYGEIRHYPKAREALEELIDLVSSNKGLRSKNRLGTPYLKLAAIEATSLNFEAALDAALKARDLYHPRKYNYFSASIYAIFTHLYLGQLREAHELLEELSWFRNQPKRIKSIELSYYLESCLNYLTGNARVAYRLLEKIQIILADKKGWNSSIRIYEIILLIDMEMLDLASSRIESLRKHLSKYQGEARHSKIFRAFYLLEKNAFDFHACDTEMQQLFYELKFSSSWKAISHELIRVDAWVRAKKQQTSVLQALMRSFEKEPRRSLVIEA